MDVEKNTPFEQIAERGTAIYNAIKNQYEPEQNGKFLAIEVDSKKAYLADTGAEALVEARAEHPRKLFYVVKIGFASAETLAHSVLHHA